ncbi:MAG: hypothetical protein H6577_14005 [Lewinellaceae bacterium]|nr:hypothetical protein [Saprospiraceae bacterium]MCB9339241.1 hypothetical protein [Lewinellaceae bacterium]
MSVKFKILAWASVFGLIGLISAYVLEFHWLANTFDVGMLVAGSILTALMIGAAAAWKWQKWGDEQVDRIRIWAACLLLPALFSPLLGSWANRLLSPYPVKNESFEFFEEKPFAESRFGFIEGEKITPDGYYIFIVHQGKIQRVKSKNQLFQGKQRGDQVELPVKKGLFGFETVMVH